MTKINIGWLVKTGWWFKPSFTGWVDPSQLTLIDMGKGMFIEHQKKNVFSLVGFPKTETKIKLADLDISAAANLLEKSTELKNELRPDSPNEQVAIYLNLFLQGLLNSIDFVLTTKSQTLFNYWLTKNQKIDVNDKNIISGYINKVTKDL